MLKCLGKTNCILNLVCTKLNNAEQSKTPPHLTCVEGYAIATTQTSKCNFSDSPHILCRTPNRSFFVIFSTP